MAALDVALAIAASGLPVFPCKADKRPSIAKRPGQPGGFYDASTDPEVVRQLFNRPSAVLVGAPTGEASGFDVLDIDTRHGGGDWLAANVERLPETRVHGTPGLPKPGDEIQRPMPGQHYLFRHAPGVRNNVRKLAPGVDIRGQGGYVIIPPSAGYSIHSDADIADWPAWLLELVLAVCSRRQAPPPLPQQRTLEVSGARWAGYIRSILDNVRDAQDHEKHDILLLNSKAIGHIRVAAGIGRAEAEQMLEDALPHDGRVADWNNARQTIRDGLDYGEREPRDLPDRPEYRRRSTNGSGNGHSGNGVEPPPHPEPEPGPVPDPDLDWRVKLIRNDKGAARQVVANTMIALRDAPEWQGVLAWNDFTNRPVLLRAMPGQPEITDGPRDLVDVDVSIATEWMQHHGLLAGSNITREAIYRIAVECRFHPVRDYLGALVWDGVERINHWLFDYFGAEETALNQAFAAKWLIGLVARVYVPGCQLDTVLILESPQGLRKSTGLRELVSSQWFTDHIPSLDNKDAQAQLQGIWLCELAELSGISRAEVHRVKAFLTMRVDRFRAAYGYIPANYPRQCGFAGTINPTGSGYLKDETGARRFWTVRIGVEFEPDQKADIAGLVAARDQLWAEAVHRYRADEPWWLDTVELERDQAAAAEERMEDDPRERKVRDFIAGRVDVHMDEILGPNCLTVPVERWNQGLRTDIGKILHRLGWSSRQVRVGRDRERRYFPPPPPPEQ